MNHQGHDHSAQGTAPTVTMKDPVCGMDVSADTPHRWTYQGTEYLFCNPSCVEKFKAAPEKYLDGTRTDHAVTPAIDPVCGMDVSADTPHRWTYRGTEYLFCNPSCVEKFKAAPDKYLHPRGHAQEAPASGPLPPASRYTCPMDPEIVRDTPAW